LVNAPTFMASTLCVVSSFVSERTDPFTMSSYSFFEWCWKSRLPTREFV
jgi:hypothetical protein